MNVDNLTDQQKLRLAINEFNVYPLKDLPNILRFRGADAEGTLQELVRAASTGRMPVRKAAGSDDLADASVSGAMLLRFAEADGPDVRFTLV